VIYYRESLVCGRPDPVGFIADESFFHSMSAAFALAETFAARATVHA